MREITLHPSVTGIDRFLSLREKIKVLQSLTGHPYMIGSPSTIASSLDDIVTAFGLQIPPLIEESYVNVYKKWTGNDQINWSKALGTKGFASAVSKYRKEILDIVSSVESTGYAETLIKGRRILENLQNIRVNETLVRSLIDEGAQLQSFIPKSGNKCPLVKYTHASKTGRLKVVDGPRVHTVAKQYRNVIVSQYRGGHIISVDFVSLEPRLALLAVGKKPGIDVYEELTQKTQESRAKTKLATLSFLYGAGAPANSDDIKIRNEVKKHFQVDRLLQIALSNGETNAYGRPLSFEDERHVIPHWVQSSAADVCLLGFSDLAESIKEFADPLFLIHDEAFFDVPPGNLQLVSEIIAKGVNVSPFGHFPVSLKELK
jgi:hypothetical protein